MITITTKGVQELERLKRQFSSQEVKRFCSASINKTVVHGRSILSDKISKNYNIKKGFALNGLKVIRSTAATLTAKIQADRRPISLTNFNPKMVSSGTVFSIKRTSKSVTKVFKRAKKGIEKEALSVEIKKGERVTIPYAFLIKNDTHKPVFARGVYEGNGGSYSFLKRHKRVNKTGSDTPITKLNSASIMGAFRNDEVNKSVKVDLQQHYINTAVSYMRLKLNNR